jgi:transposase
MEEAVPMELLTMTQRELNRLVALRHLETRELTQTEVAAQLRISVRQVKRLWRRYRSEGEAGVTSRRRGRPSNNRTDPELLARAVQLYRQHYDDFGPTLASEKLLERRNESALGLALCTARNNPAYFALVRQHIRSHGVPLAYYSDRDSIFRNSQGVDHAPRVCAPQAGWVPSWRA